MSDTPQTMKMLPGDEIRQIMWRYSDRYDIQMAVMGARSVARGLVARLVANGERNTHEWTEGKNSLYQAFDESGITAAGLDPDGQADFLDRGQKVALNILRQRLQRRDVEGMQALP